MTREEATRYLLNILPFVGTNIKEALEMAIKALEQESSGDLISRQAVYHILDEVGGDFDKPREAVVPVDYIADMVGELPPVTPQSKVGHWIRTYGNVKCSVCGSVKDSREVGKATHYCDFCGAKMVEPQESEDKE